MEVENSQILHLPAEIKCLESDVVIHSYQMSTVDENVYSRFSSDYDLDTEEYLGSGANGVVVCCKNRLDEKTYAIKKISVFVDEDFPFEELMREAVILSKFNNPAIVRYHSVWIEPTFVGITGDPQIPTEEHPVETDQPCLYIQQELCDCTVEQKMKAGALTLEECAHIFLETAKGLKHIHGHNIMHGDIKKANIFFSNGLLKIGDFGLAQEIGDGTNEIKTRPPYSAPDELVNAKADVFSLGILLVEMLLNSTGGHKASEVIRMLTKRGKAELPDSWPDGLLKTWVMRMLKKEPSQRASSSRIRKKKVEIEGAILKFHLKKKQKVHATAEKQIEGMQRKHRKPKNVKGKVQRHRRYSLL
ncbi:eukaryotic translation initiation factor 2-alpha kinase 3-like [Rosa sericea]